MKDIDNTMSVRPPRADVHQGSLPTSRVSGTASTDSAKTGDVSGSGSGGDTVTFTNTVAKMLKLEESLASIPDVDNARVTAIKASIAEGSYQIDAGKIVDNLLQAEKDLN